ncbi:serine protease, S1-C subfamily, contains C-terminal PDZ domain [Paenibacillus sp. UNCCL117]|uniref:S1C family serine protease n=1 Tax=unclassified Paenibacillus TaxID=185978 RepID=UPI000880F5DF|nr:MULTISPECIES: trypsin-like peptidase domain-containing protein [unclassified Paenibacillus]SDD76906.1 serine protease, S1-C subfamily, contains C-terminal PDZ domain [Paenibacillus sp. cl123]SFW52579.1 serine protease, S1-C subfamily, contains C-terminal PDZ domain [Paenibacillus sp. UNCCL117]
MKNITILSRKAALAAASAVLLATLAAPIGTYAYTAAESAIPAVIEQTTSSVVAIIGKPMDSKKVWEASRYNLAHGTGVIVRSNGYILTNAHVVKDMHNMTVVLSDGKSYTGKTTHYDEESDLALVKIEATGLKAAQFANPSDIRVGEPVMAIGTPLSFALRNSVTYGIVSGMERSVQSKYQLIQTDAAINPGNSGGALLNMKGEVIGINTLKYVEYGVDSLGFAIPVHTVQHVLDHFFKYGKVKRPYLGIELGESWEAVVGIPSGNGLEVTYVEPDSPAAKAGIKQGDVLLAIESSPTGTLVQYNEALKNYLPDQKIKLTLKSGSTQKVTEVALGEDESSATSLVQDAAGSYIDADQGKTHIGDSHYGWSMKYPAGLIKSDQDADGRSVSFMDAKGEFSIDISIESDQSEDLSPLGLLRKLDEDRYGYTILEKRYIDQKPNAYALLVGKSSYSGELMQSRVFLRGDTLFRIMLTVHSEELYTSSFKRNSYNDLLDSFVLSYDENNAGLKDISVYQTTDTVATEYGIAFDVPADWDGGGWGSSLSYHSEDEEKALLISVTSAASGDTLKAWAERGEKKFEDRYAADYRKTEGARDIVIDGVPAVENEYAYTMGDKWHHVRVIYLIKDKYKYELAVYYPGNADMKEMESVADTLKKSIHFPKEWANRSLGFIQDEDDLLDPARTVTYTSKKYRYALKAPESWYGGYDSDKDSPVQSFLFEGGGLTVAADDSGDLQSRLNALEKEHKKNAEADAAYSYTVTDEELFGVPVKKFATQYKSRNIPYTLHEYVFTHENIVYSVRLRINDAVKTDEQWKRLNETFQSMTFTGK